MIQTRLKEFLQRLAPPTRSNLLDELERLELSGAEMPGSIQVMETLRAEFRSNGQTQKRNSIPARYFFAPLEPLLVEGALNTPRLAAYNAGRCRQSGNGSAATCCRRWRAITPGR